MIKWFYLIPLLMISVILLKIYRSFKKKNFGENNYLPFILPGIYFISAFAILFADPVEWYPYFNITSYSAKNFFIYSLFIFLYLLPCLNLRPLNRNEIYRKSKLFTFLLNILGVLAVYSFIYQLPYAIQGLKLGAVFIRNQMNREDIYLLPDSTLTTLAVGISYFYLFYIVLFFIAVVNKESFFVKITLLIGSLSYIISGLTFTTRDVFIFYFTGFLFCYYLFKNIMPKISKKTLKRLSYLISLIVVSGLLLFSYQRFYLNNDDDTFAFGTIGYIAQQPFVFSETISVQSNFYDGNLRFPVFKQFIGGWHKIERKDNFESSFGTFIKDFYSEGGYTFLILFTIIFVPLFYKKIIRIKNKGTNINVTRLLIIYLFYFQFMSTGVFYFTLGSRAGNYYFIILFILYITSYFTLIKYRPKISKEIVNNQIIRY